MCFTLSPLFLFFGQYKDNPEAYRRTARHWTCAYAGAKDNSRDLCDKVARITEMGFDEVRTEVQICS